MWCIQRLSSKYVFITIVVFVVGSLVYGHYWYNFSFYNQLFIENISIEQTLEQIPTCASNDRSRQRALLNTLQEWIQFTRQHGIQYWIAYGTLLGYVQRHTLLPQASSIDLFIMAQETLKLVELSHLNFSATYKLKVHPQWYLADQIKRSYFHSKGIDFLIPNARFVNTKDNFYINIWPIYDYNPNEGRMEKKNKAMLTSYDRNYQWKSSPRDWTFPLRECKFSGMTVWCPREAEKLASDLYGELSINMTSIRCINGSWVTSNDYKFVEKKHGN